MTLKFNRVVGVVEVDARAKLHQAKCIGSPVINSALDFGQLETLIANISGTDQAIDKRKIALSTTIFPRSMRTIWWDLVHLRDNDLDLWPMTLKFNRVCAVWCSFRQQLLKRRWQTDFPVRRRSLCVIMAHKPITRCRPAPAGGGYYVHTIQ